MACKRKRMKRNKEAHKIESPCKQRVLIGRSVEGMAIYVWKVVPKDCEHDLS